MRAARVMRLDGPDAIEISDVAEPTGDGVVVEVHAAGAAFPDALLSRAQPGGCFDPEEICTLRGVQDKLEAAGVRIAANRRAA